MALYHQLEQHEKNFVTHFKSIVSNKQNITFFDIGTNRGLFIDLFYDIIEKTQIHCFEPNIKLFDDLNKKYKNKNIYINNKLITNEITSLDFFQLNSEITDGCSSIIERNVFNERNWSYSKIKMESDTIDNYCYNNNINHIDFLKIDVEGAEFLVLLGAEKMLLENSIDFIQFEYGDTFKDANVTLMDIYDFIINKGYELFSYDNNIFDKIDLKNINEYSKRVSNTDYYIKNNTIQW